MAELYANEEIYMYDPETGTETDLASERRQKAEESEFIAQSQKLESLKRNRGWKVLTSWLNECIAHYQEALIHEQDQQKIYRFQEAIKCYRNIENFVDAHVKEGKEFLERKRTLEDQANPKE